MQGKRRRSKGMLSGLIKYSKESPYKKKSLGQRIGFWIGATAIVVASAAILVGLLIMAIHPDIGVIKKEGDFEVAEVRPTATGFLVEEKAVAAAWVTIERRWVQIPLRADNRAGVEPKRILHVNYTFTPRLGLVKVDSWTLKP
jgi:hypothetical protein